MTLYSSNMATPLSKSYYHSPGHHSPFLGRSLGQQFYLTADKYPDKEMYVFYADKERKTFQQVREEIGCKALVLTRSPDNVYDTVCEIVPELRSCRADKLKSQSFPDLTFVAISDKHHKGKGGVYNFEDLILQGRTSSYKDKVTEICHQIDMDDPAIIVFTSGSTGTPKAVTHSNHSLLDCMHENGNMYRGNVEGYVQTWETRYLLIMHLSGMSAQFGAVIPIANGNTVVVAGPNYDKDLMAMALHEERCTTSAMLIHHMHDLLDLSYLDSLDFSQSQLIVSGGTMIPQLLREKSKQICKFSLMCYGLTEMVPILFQHPTDDPKRIKSAELRCVGGCEAKIVDDNGVVVPVNTTGEILVRGYSMFLYYWGDEEKTKQAKDANGWLHTGDMGIMDEDGYIRIVGRQTDFMIIEGITVTPFDLEEVLLEHPSIAAVMVFGVPDERTNEAVCVCIRLKTGMHLLEEDVKLFCENKVSSFLTPRHVLFVDKFPTTATGKDEDG